MSETLTISIKTLTPIWTGDVNGRCSEIKETGIIGSLRWWYEAIVRGLGGKVCDSLNESCEFDTKGYGDALRSGKSIENALAAGLKEVCPVCRLFGCNGWKRQFQLHIGDAPTTPLHFRTSANMNKNWLKRMFGGESQKIDDLNVFYGDIIFRLTFRVDADYVHSQLNMLLRFISEYGGLGAKMQHGFGLVHALDAESAIKNGLKELSQRIKNGAFLQEIESSSNVSYNLENFICLNYDLAESSLAVFKNSNSHLGNKSKIGEDKYLPCSFDIRYKGWKNIGMRVWLEKTEGWSHNRVNALMGVSEKKGESISDEDRASSHLFFGMPYKLNDNNYRLKIFGFAPPSALNPDDLSDLCEKYMRHAFGKDCKSLGTTFGREIIKLVKGGGQE